ncbi:translocon-associated protein subunit beta [Monoraphidium neglectum]|uniref:Translocon-associated protein subunit beta n=1 Tax=Monoraphidium neglectum TaxID=145388 RepID=A0A0D2MIZ1_9CHLO|nr:translocon-associated protein subunit beta [Monoraphidium neglectum]KIZ00592.1 translocon-associated protein subunit beta [Monoraphidium neglectum]|eukprot:XP_013899611.1 translocon-associated protein subunit beta [Monoraphidium neglectum]
MARWQLVLLFGLVLSASLHRVASEEAADADVDVEDAPASGEAEDEDYADTERAHLIVRKWFKEDQAVQGRNLTVNLEVYNAGNAAASDVKLTDSKAPEGFTIADGLTDASFAKIDVGSKVQHSYVLSVATATDMQAFEPARVSYAADADGEQQLTVSTVAYVEVLTPTQQLQNHLLTGGKYVSLGMLRTGRDWITASALLAVLAALLGGNSAYKSVTTARTNVRRKKALASLEKDE